MKLESNCGKEEQRPKEVHGEQLAGREGREAVIVHRDCVLLSRVSVNRNVPCTTKMALRQIHVARNNKTYLRLHANCQIILSDFNQIRSSSTDLNKRRQYQISQRYVLWDQR